MTHDAAPPSAPPSSAVSAIGGAVLGAVIACMAKGALIGIDQMDSGFSWLSVPIDAIGGIGLLFVDVLMLTGPSGVAHMIVLPWAMVGAVVGAYVGWRSARRMTH